jgi:hypothetical protein
MACCCPNYDRSCHILVNPVLDERAVPVFVIEYVLFYELLHVHPERDLHNKDFKRWERVYKHYDKAIVWTAGNWKKVLAGRRGKRGTGQSQP